MHRTHTRIAVVCALALAATGLTLASEGGVGSAGLAADAHVRPYAHGCRWHHSCPKPTPTPKPTVTPTPKPTETPTVSPTATPTASPTVTPTVSPVATPPPASPTATATATATSTPTSPPTWACVTTQPKGVCGPYSGTPGIDGTTEVDANVWSGDPGYHQTIDANGAANWQAVVNTTGNGGAILAYPNTWVRNAPWNVPVDSIASVQSSWSTTFPHNATTVGWSAYDLWFNNWGDEVMIQTDISAGPAYNCTPVASATFGGSPWHLCVFGSERVWKHGTDDAHLINEASGSIDIAPFLTWMEAHGYLPAGSTWTAGSFGFEVANTGGADATFAVHGFNWHAA